MTDAPQTPRKSTRLDGYVAKPRTRKPKAAPGEKPEGWANAEPTVGATGQTRTRGYRWEPFQPGHTLSLKHGTGGKGHLRLSQDNEVKALALAKQLLGHEDVPEYLTWPQFRPQVEAWARHEQAANAILEYMEGMTQLERMSPTTPGGHTTPVELWLSIERGAERARKELGLTPASWAKIQRDLGLAHKAEEDRLAVAAKAGAQIRAARRAAQAIQVKPEPVPEGDGDA